MAYLDDIQSRRKDKKSEEQQAIVSDSMSLLANVLSSIPMIKGDKGEKGEKGDKGDTGKDGKNGRDGKDGIGKNGKNGKDGKDGIDGRNGIDGKTPVKGIHYFDGKDGVDGKDGADGEDGKSAYEVAVANGFDGSEKAWLKSLKGQDGVNTFVTNGKNPYATVGYGKVKTLVAGSNVTVDSTDPENPVISATGGGSSPLTTKGDVYTYDSADARLGVGADGQVLTADSAEATGLKWSTPAGSGDMLASVYDPAAGAKQVAFAADLATVATTGAYSDLTGTPSIPTQYTDEMAQDAVGSMVDSTLTYTDSTPELKVANPVVPAATGFTITAGTTPKTLTVSDTAAINQDVRSTATPTFAGASFIGHTSPSADSTYTLGTSSLYWSNTYTDVLQLNATASLSGGTAGTITANGVLTTTSASATNNGMYINTGATGNRASINLRGYNASNSGDFFTIEHRTDTAETIMYVYDVSASAYLTLLNYSYIANLVTFSTSITMADAKNFNFNTTTGTKIGTSTAQKLSFHNATPTVQDTGWAVTNVTEDKTFDANATTIDEVADVVGTLINKLIAKGLIGA